MPDAVDYEIFDGVVQAPGMLVAERVEALVLARARTARGVPPDELVAPLARFAPAAMTPAAWLDHLEQVAARMRVTGREVHAWPHLAERVFPALALGIAAGDRKAHARLVGRDAWAGAIVGRALGLWTEGPPPSLGHVCDALAWRELGLPGAPKRCPDEIRALFVQRMLGCQPAPPGRLVRLLAAREVAAPRPELDALRDALVRGWLAGKTLGARPFAADVRALARAARDGVFGERKVFIASVWHELRRQPPWAALTLDDFKARLVAAHRAGDLHLARADLVAAMDPALVAASEIVTEGASFHFIVREHT